MTHALPSLPSSVRPLSDTDAQRLNRMYPSFWSTPASCKTCDGKGVFLGRDGETECDCASQWMLYRFLLNAGVPLMYQRISWDDVDAQVPESVQEVIADYAAEADRYLAVGLGLILHGQHGTGKTLLGAMLLKSLLSEGIDAYFTQFNTMLDDHTAGWQSKTDKDWFTRRVMNAGMLMVDDIGKESKGRENVTNSMFDQVIRHRVANDRPTIITTNYTLDEMRSGYGGGVMSLLTEKCFDHEVTGRDFRSKARERNLADMKAGIRRPVTLS